MTEITVYQCDGCGYEVRVLYDSRERDARPATWKQDDGDDLCESCFHALELERGSER